MKGTNAMKHLARSREEFIALRERSIARVTKACGPLYEHTTKKPGEPMWIPEMGPLNKWERDLAREIVSEQVTYEVAMAATYSPFRRMC